MKNDELIRRFDRGHGNGSAARMKITEAEDGASFLWDYGWALIAYRSPAGEVSVYEGWKGYSATTTKHIRLFNPGEASYAVCRADHYVDARPKIPRTRSRGFDPDGREELEPYNYEQIHP